MAKDLGVGYKKVLKNLFRVRQIKNIKKKDNNLQTSLFCVVPQVQKSRWVLLSKSHFKE